MNVFTVFPKGQINLHHWMHIQGDTWIHKGSNTIMCIFPQQHYVTMHVNRKPSATAVRAMITLIRRRARRRRIIGATWAMSRSVPREIIRITMDHL